MTKNDHHQALLESKIPSIIWHNSHPMVIAIIMLFMYELIESTLVALHSAQTLTAYGFTLPITAAMTALAIGTSIRCNNKVVKVACHNKQAISKTITLCLVLSTIIISLLSVLMLSLSDQTLNLLGSTHWITTQEAASDLSLMSQQSDYINTRYISWVFLGVIWQINAILRALNFTKLASNLMLAWVSFKGLIAIALLLPSSPMYNDSLYALAIIHGTSDVLFALISLYLLHKRASLQCFTLQDFTEHLKQPKTACGLVITVQLILAFSMAILTAIAATFSPN